MKRIILASNSPRRKNLLEQTGLKFTVIDSKIEETYLSSLKAKEVPQYLAFKKASAVQKQHPQAVIIAADTVVVLGKKIYGKPKSEKEAKEYLKYLSGKQHLIITSIAILYRNKTLTKTKMTKVLFKDISENQIDSYLKTKEWIDKAGAYAIQGKGRDFVEKIEGDYFSAVGLPINEITKMLKNFGINANIKHLGEKI